MRDPYEVLGIAPTATLADAEVAYRARLQEVHPDRHPDADDADQVVRARQTQELTEAIRELRLQLREVRELGRCPSCAAPLSDLDQACPVCRADPSVAPWWQSAPGTIDSDDVVPGGGPVGHADQWSVTPVASNAMGAIVWGILLLLVVVLVAVLLSDGLLDRFVD